MIIESMQFMLLLPLIGAFVPQIVKDFLTQFNFLMFNFDFILAPIDLVYNSLEKDLSWTVQDGYLRDIGIRSSCAILNHLRLIIYTCISIPLHVIVWILYRKYKDQNRWWVKILKSLYEAFMLSYYLRIIIEGYLIILLSWEHEIYRSRFSNLFHIISYCLTISIVCFLLFIVLLIIGLERKNNRASYNYNKSRFREFFEGARQTRFGRILTVVVIFRILFSVTWIVCLNKANKYVRIALYHVIQIGFTVIVIIMRPYKSLQDNLLETMNNLFYIILWSLLLEYNQSSEWNDTITCIFMGIIMFNVFIYGFIKLCILVCVLWKKCYQYRKKSDQVTRIHNKSKHQIIQITISNL